MVNIFPDELDLRLLNELRKDSRRSVRQLAKSLNQSPSTIYNRVKRLEVKDVIKRWTVNLDYSQLNLSTTAFILVKLNTFVNGEILDPRKIAKEISKIKGVFEVHLMTAEWDLIVKVRAKNIKEIGELSMQKIRTIPGVEKTVTNTCFETILENGDIFIPS